jgi:hypothetical protein
MIFQRLGRLFADQQTTQFTRTPSGCIATLLRQVKNPIPIDLSIAHKLVATVLAGLLSARAQTSQSTHKITVTFDYDFWLNPACSPEVTEGCVQQFNIYEISQGVAKRVKLASIPVPPDATGIVHGISGTTEPVLFDTGRHRIAVSAQRPNGSESDLSKCAIVVAVP